MSNVIWTAVLLINSSLKLKMTLNVGEIKMNMYQSVVNIAISCTMLFATAANATLISKKFSEGADINIYYLTDETPDTDICWDQNKTQVFQLKLSESTMDIDMMALIDATPALKSKQFCIQVYKKLTQQASSKPFYLNSECEVKINGWSDNDVEITDPCKILPS